MKQVGLTQSNSTVQEHRVIGFCRAVGHRHAGGMRHAVAGAHNEIIKMIARDQSPIGSAFLTGKRAGFVLQARVIIFHFTVPDDKFNLSGPVAITGQQAGNSSGQTALQPIAGVSILDADNEFSVDLFDQFGAAYPGVKRRLGHFHLKLADCCLPCLLSIHKRSSRKKMSCSDVKLSPQRFVWEIKKPDIQFIDGRAGGLPRLCFPRKSL